MRYLPHLIVPILASVLLVTAGAGNAQAESLVLDKGFTPHPFRTAEIQLQTEDVRIPDLGYRKCGSSHTTKMPALTWEFKSPMSELVVSVETREGAQSRQDFVVVLPNGSFLCSQKGSRVYFKNWPAGQYKMWMFGRSRSVGGVVAFEDPSRSKGDVKNALGTLPTIDFSADGPNPRFTTVKPTRMALASDLGIGCGAKRGERIMPLARLKVTRTSTYYVGIANKATFIATADRKCGARQTQLGPGVHTLWLRVPHGEKLGDMALETDDIKRSRAFGDRPKRVVTALDQPMVIPGKLRPSEWWGSRSGNCRGAARDPDFLLVSNKPLQDVTMSLLWGRKPQHLHVYGPLEEKNADSNPRCSAQGYRANNTHQFDVFEGTYAVWVGDGQRADGVGSDYRVLLRRDHVAINPLTAFAPVPAQIDMHERAYRNHYPFFTGTPKNWELLFTRAPRQLFVFARVEIRQRQTHVRAGEPLVVGSWGRDMAWVRHHDGSRSRVKTKLLTSTWPSSLWLPTKPTFKKTPNLKTAIRYSGPEDRKAIAAYEKVEARYVKCFGRYMEKHDPTWGKNHEVYKIDRRGKVENVGDEIAARADRKCGANALTRAENKLLQRLDATRRKRLVGHLRAIRARFGL